jgi:CheY-like chemotaxis protein
MEKRKVLIVDDDPDICTNFQDILEDLGYTTDVALDGSEALRQLKQQSYDVVLLDFNMPGMDGATVYTKMREIRSDVVAIMITAHAAGEGVQKALAGGGLTVMRKPVDFPELLAHVETAVGFPNIENG